MKLNQAYISVGSNIGDKLAYCQNSIKELAESKNSIVTGQSFFYRTQPVDYTDQDWFINAVFRIQTTLDPYQLLEKINKIELKAGRDRKGVRFGPRTLDMDIIFYNDLVLNSPNLTLPHPRMHKRRFVLQPVCDIDPNLIHPLLNKDMKSLLDSLDEKEQDIVLYN